MKIKGVGSGAVWREGTACSIPADSIRPLRRTVKSVRWSVEQLTVGPGCEQHPPRNA